MSELRCGHIFEYECTRCKHCYICNHIAIYKEKFDKWYWKCADGNIRKAICEKIPEDRGRRRESAKTEGRE